MFWDTTTCNAIVPAVNEDNLENQPGMSPELGMEMMDTMIRYWTPRACVLFGWECANQVVVGGTSSSREPAVDANRIQVSPNPSSGELTFQSSPLFPIERIKIYNVSGALMYEQQVENDQFTVDDIGLSSGIFFAKIQFEDGVATKKITISR